MKSKSKSSNKQANPVVIRCKKCGQINWDMNDGYLSPFKECDHVVLADLYGTNEYYVRPDCYTLFFGDRAPMHGVDPRGELYYEKREILRKVSRGRKVRIATVLYDAGSWPEEKVEAVYNTRRLRHGR